MGSFHKNRSSVIIRGSRDKKSKIRLERRALFESETLRRVSTRDASQDRKGGAFRRRRYHPPVRSQQIAGKLEQVARLYAQNDYTGALDIAQAARELAQKYLNPGHPLHGLTANNQGVVVMNLGNHQKASELFREALSNFDTCADPIHAASTHQNYGALYYRQGNYLLARYHYQKSLEQLSEILGEQHPGMTKTLAGVAVLNLKLEEYDQAEDLFKKSLHIFDQTLGAVNLESARTWGHLAALYERKKDYSTAARAASKALQIRQKIAGDPPAEMVQNLTHLGLLYAKNKQYTRAMKYIDEALELGALRLGENHPSLQHALRVRQEVQRARQQPGGAEQLGRTLPVELDDVLEPGIISEPSGSEPPSGGHMPPGEVGSGTHAPAGQGGGRFIRYPDLECPRTTPPAQVFTVFVQLRVQPRTAGQEGISIHDNVPPDQPVVVTVVLRAPDFDILEGSNTRTLQVDREKDTEVPFKLRPQQEGIYALRADFYADGLFLGATPVYPVEVTSDPANRADPPALQSAGMDMGKKETSVLPDLEILIYPSDPEGKNLTFYLNSTIIKSFYHKPCGHIYFKNDPIDEINKIFIELNQQTTTARPEPRHFTGPAAAGSQGRGSGVDPELALRGIESFGILMWDEFVPDEVQKAYRDFKSRAKTILIKSSAPWIPYELVKPYDFDPITKLRKDDPFWCEQFEISNWNGSSWPVDRLDTRRVQPVSGATSHASDGGSEMVLRYAAEEVEFIQKLGTIQPSLRVSPPLSKPLDVIKFLEKEDFHILHFACHGSFKFNQVGKSEISLEGGRLRSVNIKVKFGGERSKPLIFINACEGGRSASGLIGIDGWAQTFVDSEAAAFIGPLWAVDDELALHFARAFYTALLKENRPIARAVQEARKKTKERAPHNPTWLAYVLYAHPECRALTKDF